MRRQVDTDRRRRTSRTSSRGGPARVIRNFFLPPWLIRELEAKQEEKPKPRKRTPRKSRRKMASARQPVKPRGEVTSVEEREKYSAEAEAAKAEAGKFRAEERRELAEAEQAEILLRSKQRAEAEELAKNQYHRVYV